MTITSLPPSGREGRAPASTLTLAWGMKRAAIGFVLLVLFVTGAILLFDAAIEPELESAPQPAALHAIRH